MAQSDATLAPRLGRAPREQASGLERFARRSAKFARKRKLGAIGVFVVLLVLGVAVLSPLIQRYDETQTFETANPEFNPTANPLEIAANPRLSTPNTLDRFESPTAKHWLGTDQFGRDIYARIIVGARLAAIIGIGASLIAVVGGTTLGLISGYFGGVTDLILQRFVDALLAFPGIVLLMLIVQVMAEPPLALIVFALGFLGWAINVRVIRSTVLSLSNAQFVEAAKSFGASNVRIMAQHILPNTMAIVLVLFSIGISAYILAEASLSFLGLGPADATTWGKMVNAGRNAIDLHPWEAVFSGCAITLAVLGFSLAGDALRDELDPRLRGR